MRGFIENSIAISITSFGVYAMAKYWHHHNISPDLDTKIDDVCNKGGGEFIDPFTSDEVSEDISFQYNGDSRYNTHMKCVKNTVWLCSIRNPLYTISHTTNCALSKMTADGVVTYVNPPVEDRRCGMWDDLECETKFTITRRF